MAGSRLSPRRFWSGLWVALLLPCALAAATVSLAPVSVAPGATGTLSVQLQAGGESISGLQFDLQYDAAKLTLSSPAAGPVATAAGKFVSSNSPSSGVLRILVVGLGQETIGSGAVVTIRTAVAASTVAGTIPVTFTGLSATDPTGSTVPLTGTAGNVTVTSGAAAFTAAPASLSFDFRVGDKTPATQTLTVTSSPSGTQFNATASTTSGGNWLTVAPASAITTALVTVGIDSGVLGGLGAGRYNGKITVSGTGATAVDVPVTLSVVRGDAPTVTQGGVVPVYSSTNAIQAGSWISIYGTNLAAAVEVWKGDFPTTLGGVTVTVNGKPGYLWFVSPTQINLQAPDDTATGTVPVVITNATGTTLSTVTLAGASPSFSLLDARHVAAITTTATGYDIIGPAGAFAFPTRPVKPGEPLILYGVGFGPTDPPAKAGQVLSAPAATVNPVTVTIGGVPAKVAFAGLVGAGLYQLNVTVPQVGAGDQPITATVNGVSVGAGPVVTIGQ